MQCVARRLARRGLAGCLCLLAGRGLPAQAATASGMDHAGRRARALAALGDRLLIVPSRAAYKTDDQAGYKQATDFQYFTGLADVVGAVLALDGGTRRATLFLATPPAAITRRIARPSDTPGALGVDEVLPVDSLAAWLPKRFGAVRGILVSGNDPRGSVRTPVPMAADAVRWSAWLADLGWRGSVGSGVEVVRPLRQVKDSAEAVLTARVGRLSGAAMLAGMRAVRPGVRQRTVEMAIIGACVQGGGVHSFWPWAMSGPHAQYTDLWNSFVDPDNHDRAMRAGEVVRVDVGCQLDQYMGDVGRTVPVSGRFTSGQRESWDLFIAGYRAGLALVRDGARVSDIFDAARRRIRELQTTLRTTQGRHAAEELLSPRGIEAWQFHNVGLDDAEGAPQVLARGMTLAYELMFVVDGDGFYLEDVLLVEPGGHRMLTAGLPYTAAEVERAMVR